MARGKGKPRDSTPSVEGTHDATPTDPTNDDELRPSATMTREVAAASPVPSAAPTTRVLDELAQTIEAEAAPRVLLLDAAESILAEGGWAAVTGEELARCAGVSVDVYHAHFASERALLRALGERLFGDALSEVGGMLRAARTATLAPAEVLERAVGSLFDLAFARRALLRAIGESGDETLYDGLRRSGADVTAQVQPAALESSTVTATSVALGLAAAASLTHHLLFLGADWSGADLDRATIRAAVVTAATAFLH